MTLKESEYWDEVGQAWKVDRPDPLWRTHSDAVNSQLLGKWLPQAAVSRLLKTDAFDEACSRGLFELLRSRHDTVMGIDISAATLVAARARHPEFRAAVADVRTLPFDEGSFDIIVSNSTLDHFPTLAELEASVRELHRVLRPGGQLILTLDNPWNPVIALRNALPFRFLNRAGIVPYYVGTTCGPRRLRRMLENSGFDVNEAGAIMHCPRVLAVVLARFIGNDTPMSRRFLSCMMAFECMARWPTRHITGYFNAMRAIKR